MAWFGKRRARNAQAAKVAGPARGRFFLFGGRRYLNNESYFLPKDDTEINRLDFQHYLLRYMLRGNYAAPLQRVTSILDVGCGTGRWAMEMARLFPEANVIGLDLVAPPQDDAGSAQALGELRPENYVFMQGNVLDGLPWEDARQDHIKYSPVAVPKLTKKPGKKLQQKRGLFRVVQASQMVFEMT